MIMDKKIFLGKFKNKGDIPHAIAIEGLDAAGRLDMALGFAMIVSCSCDLGEKPCHECSSCTKISGNAHPDIKIISAGDCASIKVDQIRQLRQDAYVIPNENEYKIFIIEDSNLMTSQAQNAFIKILEEPPKNVIFVLVCESIQAMLETIRSRVQIFSFMPSEEKSGLEVSIISEKLAEIAVSESKGELLETISKIPNNRIFLRRVLNSLLENLVKFAAKNRGSVSKAMLDKIETIRFLANAAEKNVNFNLIVSYLATSLL